MPPEATEVTTEPQSQTPQQPAQPQGHVNGDLHAVLAGEGDKPVVSISDFLRNAPRPGDVKATQTTDEGQSAEQPKGDEPGQPGAVEGDAAAADDNQVIDLSAIEGGKVKVGDQELTTQEVLSVLQQRDGLAKGLRDLTDSFRLRKWIKKQPEDVQTKFIAYAMNHVNGNTELPKVELKPVKTTIKRQIKHET